MKKIFIALSLLPLLLVGCDDGEKFADLNPGDKIVLTSSNVTTYLKVNLKHSEEYDKQGSVTELKYTLASGGYSELSYFIDYITCTIAYTFLGDDGNLAQGTNTITINPAKDGKAKKSLSYSCNYRSVSAIHLDKFDLEGYVVKK